MTSSPTPAPRLPLDPLRLIISLPLIAGFTAVYAGGLLAIAIGIARLSGLEVLRPLAIISQGTREPGTANPQWLTFLLGVLLYIGASAAVLTLARWWGGRGWRISIAWNRWLPGSARWVWGMTGAALVYGIIASVALAYFQPDSRNWFMISGERSVLVLSFLLVVVLAPLAEELLFRGWAYTALRPHWGFGSSLGATSTVFALLHWEKTHVYALVVLPLGCLLGVAREKSGSVRATILMHAVYNSCGWLATVTGAG